MRPELLSELRSGDAQWILRAGRLLAEDGERSAGLLKTSAYQQLCDVAHEQLSELANIAPDKLREQLEQLLLLDGVPVGLQWLYDSGALSQLLPELHATVNFSQEAGRRHKDVWEHTKQVVWQAPPRPMVRWSALLHDIGKVKTRAFTPDGKVTFHRHSEVGARMFDDIGRRFQFERGSHRSLRFLILHHLRPNAYSAIVDGLGGAALCQRDWAAAAGSPRSVAGRYHLAATGATAAGAVEHRYAVAARRSHPWRRRDHPASAQWNRRRHHGQVSDAGLEADWGSQARAADQD
jgi:putative nucleotidyltransferase with HDIG domain